PRSSAAALPDRSPPRRVVLSAPECGHRGTISHLLQEGSKMNGWVAVAVSSLVVVAVALQASSLVAQAQTKAYVEIKREAFQKEVDARPTDLYMLKNGTGMVVKITNQGAKIVQILVPDKSGQLGDVVLGYETVDQYVAGRASYGAIIGRYANRIAKGRFTLNGQEYQLPVNNGPNQLH